MDGSLEDRVRLGLYAEMQRNHLILTTQGKRVGTLPTNIIVDNPLLLLVYAIGLDAGLRGALTIVDYAKLAEILYYDPVCGGDRAIP